MKVGTTTSMSLPGKIQLHGQSQSIIIEIVAAKLSNNRVIVSAKQPLLIRAQDFALIAGIAKLQSLAGLPSISNTVPVTFVLQFERK